MHGRGRLRSRVILELMLAAGRVPGSLGRLLCAVVAGTLLARLGEASLRELDELYYERAELYHTELWNLQGLLPWERELVQRTVRPAARVAVLGCGGGREVLGLLRSGYDAVGYESHPDLAVYAAELLNRHGFASRVSRVSRDSFPPGEEFDAVLIGWGLASLIAPAARRRRLLSQVAAAVPAGGTIILSAFVTSTWGRDLRLTHRISGRRTELGDTMAPNRVHVFTPQQLSAELLGAGWQPEPVRIIGGSSGPVGYGCITGRRA